MLNLNAESILKMTSWKFSLYIFYLRPPPKKKQKEKKKKHRERTMISYAKYNQVILKLFVPEFSQSFSNLLPPSFDKAGIIQKKPRILHLILDCSMTEYLKFPDDFVFLEFFYLNVNKRSMVNILVNQIQVNSIFMINKYTSYMCITTFFQFRLTGDQFCPLSLKGKGQPRVIVLINFVGFNSEMLRAKFKDHRMSGSGEEYFHHILSWRSCWWCDLEHLYKSSSSFR